MISRNHTALLAAVVMAATSLLPSSLHAQVVQTRGGPLEFIGLEKWNAAVLWDSIHALAPGAGAHACATVLKENFGFADASVHLMRDSAGAMYWTATVVEPQHAGRVRYRPIPAEHALTDPAVLPIAQGFFDDALTTQIGMITYRYVAAGHPDSALRIIASTEKEVSKFRPGFKVDSAGVAGLWSFLRSAGNEAMKAAALRTLMSDGNDTNRIVAAARLINFPDDPEVWYALMDAQRDSSNTVSATARSILSGFAREAPHRIDWRPAAGSIRAILGGTNLFSFDQIADVLAETGIAPALAAELLHDNYHLALAKLKARHPATREHARLLLVQLRGEDLGDDPKPWEMWLQSL